MKASNTATCSRCQKTPQKRPIEYASVMLPNSAGHWAGRSHCKTDTKTIASMLCAPVRTRYVPQIHWTDMTALRDRSRYVIGGRRPCLSGAKPSSVIEGAQDAGDDVGNEMVYNAQSKDVTAF